MLRLEARPEPSKALSLASPLIALVLTAVIAAMSTAIPSSRSAIACSVASSVTVVSNHMRSPSP